MTWLLGLLLDNWQWLLGAIGIAGGAFFVRKGGKDAVLASQAKDAAKRADKGRKAQAQAAEDLRAGKTPEEIVRDNDGAWR